MMYWDSKSKNKKRKIEEEDDEESMDLSLIQLLSGLKKIHLIQVKILSKQTVITFIYILK